ncbi:MAG: dinitrogenase iron-molybdenum cofactor biosynthesis protein [Candidatus Aenigmatarchaeota archaeon]|nr:MAG: dinitrogenase iron-molybdenum cofactor biosynthesis protein [Candidatus Aenigmarchaeota archaeon]
MGIMKIAFASEENKGLESTLSCHLGRCPYYLFVEIENNDIKNVEIKENPFFNRHEPGIIPQFIVKQKVDVIIAGGMGPRAMSWFEKLKVKTIITKPRKIKDILKDYLSGKL